MSSASERILRAMVFAIVVAALVLAHSGSAFAGVPRVKHVVVVVEENHSYRSVVGSTAMPYLNSLAKKYGLATRYYANTHPSIGNYFMLTTGKIITNNDGWTGTVTSNNIVRRLLIAGKTWKSYAESLPYSGYIGGDRYPYVKHHNPFAYFSDVRNSSNERLHLVPFSQFSKDLANGQLPNFSFVVPNALHNGHDGSLATADDWLETRIAPLLSNSAFRKSGILVILFDESFNSDTAYGGGHIAMLVIGPSVKSGVRPGEFYQHQSTLKLALQASGLDFDLGAAGSAATMEEFFR
jgi:acid phosphatase